MKTLRQKMLAVAGDKKRDALESRQKHHSDMQYWHNLKMIHHEKEFNSSGDIKHQHEMNNHRASAEYHGKQGELVHKKIMDHIGKQQYKSMM